MIVPPDRLLLLDTSVLIQLARGKEIGQRWNEAYGLSTRPERPLLCGIVEGEIRAMALNRGWGSTKLAALEDIFGNLVRVSSNHPAVIAEYASLYAEAWRTGKPKGENDLWIAATAKAYGAALLTADRDFE